MPSKFRLNSLKTNDWGTHKVTHFFEGSASDNLLKSARNRETKPSFSREQRQPVAAPAGAAPAAEAPAAAPGAAPPAEIMADRRLSAMGYGRAIVIGSAQILALLAGISRDGVTMVAGMNRGLSREDAARFAFLLATPVILAAGALKIPDLAGPLGSGVREQILTGSLFSGIGAYLSVRFLLRYFQTRTLTPFAIYCTVAGLGSLAYLTLT